MPAIRAHGGQGIPNGRMPNGISAREAGATQKEVAAAEGISQPRVAQVEREQREYKERQSAVSYNAPPPRSQQYAGISGELPRAPVQPTPSSERGGERIECAPEPMVSRHSDAKA